MIILMTLIRCNRMGEEIKAAAKDAQSYLTIDYVQFNLNQSRGFCLSFLSFVSFFLFDDEIGGDVWILVFDMF